MSDYQREKLSQQQTIRVKTVLQSIFLVSSFVESFVRGCNEGVMIFYFQTFLGLSVRATLKLYHSQVALVWCGYLSPIFTKKITVISSYGMLVLLTIFEMTGFITFCVVLFVMPDMKEELGALWLSFAVCGALIVGCKCGHMKQAMYDQYIMPKEAEEYIDQYWHMMFAGFVGRFVGYVNIWAQRNGAKINFLLLQFVTSVFLIVDVALLLVGWFVMSKWPRYLRETTRSETLEKHITHLAKQGSPSFKDVSKNCWGVVKTILPLYPVAIAILAWRPLRSSRFIQQAKELDLRIMGTYWAHPTLLNVVYPLALIVLLYPYRFLNNYLKKRRIFYSTIHKTLIVLILTVLSATAASELSVFIDDREGSENRFRGGAVVVYNALECTATIKTKVHTNVKINPISHVILFSTEDDPISKDNGHTMTVDVPCAPYNSSLAIKLEVRATSIQEYLLAANLTSSTPHKALISHLGSREIDFEFFFNNYLKVVHYAETIHINVSVDRRAGAGGSKFYQLLPGHSQTPLEVISIDTYSLTANGMLLNEIDVKFGTSITILIAQSIERKTIPLSRVIVIKHPNRIRYYWQFPQIFSQALADLVMDSPGFVFASNAVTGEWRHVLQLSWFLCGVIAQLLMILYIEVFESERQMYNFLMSFCSVFWASAYYWEFIERFYQTDHERHSKTKSIDRIEPAEYSPEHVKHT